MGETTTISIEVSTATAERLEALARSTNRSTTTLARQAIDQFLEVDDWHATAIDQAVAELDAGSSLIAHEDMDRWLANPIYASEASACAGAAGFGVGFQIR